MPFLLDWDPSTPSSLTLNHPMIANLWSERSESALPWWLEEARLGAHIPWGEAAHIPAAAHNLAAVLHTPVAAVGLHNLAAVPHIPEGFDENYISEGKLPVVLQMQRIRVFSNFAMFGANIASIRSPNPLP